MYTKHGENTHHRLSCFRLNSSSSSSLISSGRAAAWVGRNDLSRFQVGIFSIMWLLAAFFSSKNDIEPALHGTCWGFLNWIFKGQGSSSPFRRSGYAIHGWSGSGSNIVECEFIQRDLVCKKVFPNAPKHGCSLFHTARNEAFWTLLDA